MAKHNELYVSSDVYCSRQHILANWLRILSDLEICFLLLNGGYGKGLTYGGTVLLLIIIHCLDMEWSLELPGTFLHNSEIQAGEFLIY